MPFDPTLYAPITAQILNLDGAGRRAMPLVARGCTNPEARRLLTGHSAKDLFPDAPSPQAALAGLWTYFSAFDEAHSVAQEDSSAEGSFWHGILHRQEPDSGNASYWFRRVGAHPLFPRLAREAALLAGRHPEAGLPDASRWDPFRFIDFCEAARSRPGSPRATVALDMQLIEWQLLFDYCARSGA